jgi:hypothetical protein
MAYRDMASSVQGRLIRVTPLTVDGAVDETKPVWISNGFITATFSHEFEDGDEITEKAADGSVCISYKAPDSFKRLNFNLSLCSPDPESAAVLAGGLLIEGGAGCDTSEGQVIGYSSPPVGDAGENPVAIEVWSTANIGGRPAAGQPWFHWVFPYVKVRYTGDREFGNAALSNEFEGQGLGNVALADTGLYPKDTMNETGAFPREQEEDWVTYRAALMNPFSYVRSCDNLTDEYGADYVERGFHFFNTGQPGVVPWPPAQVISPNETMDESGRPTVPAPSPATSVEAGFPGTWTN